jgi:hypothetical protein
MQLAPALNMQKVLSLRATDILAALNCLNYLISQEAEDPAKVRQYTTMAQERLHAFSELMGPVLWKDNPPRPAVIAVDQFSLPDESCLHIVKGAA